MHRTVVIVTSVTLCITASSLIASVQELISDGLPFSSYTASATYLDHTPDRAFDGIMNTLWNAPTYSGWIEVDLGAVHALSEIQLLVSQTPNGIATHQIWLSASPIAEDLSSATMVTELSGWFEDYQLVPYSFDPGTSARYLQIRSPESVSWIGWWEIQVFASSVQVPTATTRGMLVMSLLFMGALALALVLVFSRRFRHA